VIELALWPVVGIGIGTDYIQLACQQLLGLYLGKIVWILIEKFALNGADVYRRVYRY
jgi:hypothetical protein